MIPQQAIELIKQCEGCKLEAYLDSGGVPTIGVGHTMGVKLGDVCTQEQADKWLEEDCEKSAATVAKYVKVPMNENELSALISFVFNVGPMYFKNSTLLKLLNMGLHDAVPKQLMRWVHCHGEVLGGLYKRRALECALWNKGIQDG